MMGGAYRGLAWLGGVLATMAAVGIGVVLAVLFAAAMAVIAVMGGAVVGLAVLATRARRTVRAGGPDVIEARNIGGHSWVAYGWDRPAS
ncbi:MAG: hypothetical protein JO303_02340 [Caulobacteraceae bacterium]|nr:hypothetical protein [Caulobacteraceae bacterium]